MPSLIQAAKTCAIPIKEKSLELLSIILYNTSNKTNLAKEIITTFANSTICYNRVSYIHFCLCISNLCSKDFFCKIFMNSLLSLATDKLSLVKYSFAKNFVNFRHLVPLTNAELARNFRYILNHYLELDDKILLNYALNADKMLTNSNWEQDYIQNSEKIEIQRIKKEQDEETKENLELENLKKIQNEENSRGFRKNIKKYTVIQGNVPRQSSVKPMKRNNLSEADKYDAKANRPALRAIKKK